jgi:hypothetical protein
LNGLLANSTLPVLHAMTETFRHSVFEEAFGFANSTLAAAGQAESIYSRRFRYILAAGAFVVGIECVLVFLWRDNVKTIIESGLGKEYAVDWRVQPPRP